MPFAAQQGDFRYWWPDLTALSDFEQPTTPAYRHAPAFDGL